MVGAFVLANNKENVNIDGCLWYFGGTRVPRKTVYFGNINLKRKKKVLLSLAYYRMDSLYRRQRNRRRRRKKKKNKKKQKQPQKKKRKPRKLKSRGRSA